MCLSDGVQGLPSFTEEKGPPSEGLGFPAMPAFTTPSSPPTHILLHPLLKSHTESKGMGTSQVLRPVPLQGQALGELSYVVWLRAWSPRPSAAQGPTCTTLHSQNL